MSIHMLSDDPSKLEEFVDGRLPAKDERQIELHLETCEECRSRLESIVGDHSFWRDAASYLADDKFDGNCEAIFRDSDLDVATYDGLALEDIAKFFDATDDPRMLGRFGGYEIAGVVGSGGMGVVLKGFEPALDRYVAIKVLAPHLATSGAARSRFAREARAAAAVLHENVVSIHLVAEAKQLPFLVMPYIPGDSLLKRLDRQGALDVIGILRIGMQIASGLAAAHAQGLVHRDIKPANILLNVGVERVTITDFGLARAADDASLTRSGMIAGTPQFMSPEQAKGEPVDARSDLYSLGSVLYAMCTGRPPFRAETPYAVLRRICESQPRPIREIAPEIPEWLVEIVQKLHAKKPERRFESASQVADLLGRWLMHLQQPSNVPAPKTIHRSDTFLRGFPIRRRFRFVVVTLAAMLLFISTIIVREVMQEGSRPPIPESIESNTATTRSTSTATLLDESTFDRNYEQMYRRISDLEKDWASTPSSPDSVDRRTNDVRRKLNVLSKRVEQFSP